MSDALLLQMGNLPADTMQPLKPFFDELKPSSYKDGAYRLRKYSKIYSDNGKLAILPNQSFMQTGNINEFQGGVVRTYDDISTQVLSSEGFGGIVKAFIKAGELPADGQIEVHQMRIIAKDDSEVPAAPEGIHQDGFDFVGVFTVGRHNLTGGELLVWQDKNADAPISQISPSAGDYCIVNDQTLWHSASAIHAKDKSDVGYWDLFVLTANKPAQTQKGIA